MALKLDAKIPAGPLAEKWDKHRFEMKLVNPANKRKYSGDRGGLGLAGRLGGGDAQRSSATT
jgi:succinate dehydrogenase / fumarate reductase flavoprotein subunit